LLLPVVFDDTESWPGIFISQGGTLILGHRVKDVAAHECIELSEWAGVIRAQRGREKQALFAWKCRVHKTVLSKWENGRLEPTPEQYAKLSEISGGDARQFFWKLSGQSGQCPDIQILPCVPRKSDGSPRKRKPKRIHFDDLSIPEWSRQIRLARGALRQADFAVQLGVNQGTLSQWEYGDTEPTPSVYRKIAMHVPESDRKYFLGRAQLAEDRAEIARQRLPELSQRIKLARGSLTQTEFARLCGVNQPVLARWETSGKKVLRKYLKALADNSEEPHRSYFKSLSK
jgi:DNA-binding transcriptional regulator YiaG